MVEALKMVDIGLILLLAFIPTACIQLVRVIKEQVRK